MGFDSKFFVKVLISFVNNEYVFKTYNKNTK